MQIGIRLHDIQPGTFQERLDLAHKQGFKCGHLAVTKMFPDYAGISQLTPGFAKSLAHSFEQAQLDVAVLGCYMNLAHPDPEKLKQIQETYYANIRFASFLGAGVVGTETGCPNAEYKTDANTHTEEALQTFIQGLRPVVACAEKFGVQMAIEPVARHIVNTPKRARQVLDAIHSPNLGIIFDPVNLLDAANEKSRESIFQEAMELLRNEIMVIHLKDYVLQDGEIVAVAAGQGEMDYTSICQFIRTYKKGIHVTLENTNSANAVQSREYLEGVYASTDSHHKD